jgi:regulator of replication initiation timing
VFALTETAMAGAIEDKKESGPKSQPVTLDRWMDVMRENTALSTQVAMLKVQIEHLTEKNAELNLLNVELNEELDEMEEELEGEEEEDEDKVSGKVGEVPRNMEQGLAMFLNKHGEQIIGLLGGNKNKIKKDEIPDEEEADNIQVSGIQQAQVKTMQGVIDELRKHDKDLFKHLYKLTLVAEQSPEIFKMFLKKLEEM